MLKACHYSAACRQLDAVFPLIEGELKGEPGSWGICSRASVSRVLLTVQYVSRIEYSGTRDYAAEFLVIHIFITVKEAKLLMLLRDKVQLCHEIVS